MVELEESKHSAAQKDLNKSTMSAKSGGKADAREDLPVIEKSKRLGTIKEDDDETDRFTGYQEKKEKNPLNQSQMV